MKSLKLSELRDLSEEEKQKKIEEFAFHRPSPEETKANLEEINEMINEFEMRYEMSSNTMREKLRKGEIKETHDICKWLMRLQIREKIKS